MLKVLVNGCNGKMGSVVCNQIMQDKSLILVGGVDVNNQDNHAGFKVYNNIFSIKETIDVIIDFSHPCSLSNLLIYCEENNFPLVIGTTGISDADMEKIKSSSKKIPIFYSTNMSLGINTLVSLVQKAASILGDNFDIEIIEKHHNRKVDAPSGTAYMIGKAINEEFDNKKHFVFGRHSKDEKRQSEEIGIHAIRGGTIVGEHEVIFAGCDEILEIKHTASSKNIFAQGAIKAAKFVHNKGKGFYNMKDIIEA